MKNLSRSLFSPVHLGILSSHQKNLLPVGYTVLSNKVEARLAGGHEIRNKKDQGRQGSLQPGGVTYIPVRSVTGHTPRDLLKDGAAWGLRMPWGRLALADGQSLPQVPPEWPVRWNLLEAHLLESEGVSRSSSPGAGGLCLLCPLLPSWPCVHGICPLPVCPPPSGPPPSSSLSYFAFR